MPQTFLTEQKYIVTLSAFCSQHKQQGLEMALLELKTAKTIIELLKDKTNSTALNTTANTQGNLL
jgi:hypothetical protein